MMLVALHYNKLILHVYFLYCWSREHDTLRSLTFTRCHSPLRRKMS